MKKSQSLPSRHSSRRQPSPAPKGCWDVSPVPAGFWGNLEKADALWQDCLAGRTPPDPIAKLAAMSRLLGLGRAPEGVFRTANVAWLNGAHLAASGICLRAVLRLAGEALV